MISGDDAAPRPGSRGANAPNDDNDTVATSSGRDQRDRTSLIDDLLGSVGVADDEILSFLRRKPDGTVWGGQATAGELRRTAPDPSAEEWLGVNPMRKAEEGRGGEADVLRVPALVCDLDYRHPQVKPDGGVPDEASARLLVSDIGEAFNSAPVVIVHSGHGLQVFWGVEASDSTDVEAMKRRARRFALLVERLAGLRGWKVDRLSDIARVWRAPGSWNHKADPVQVGLEMAPGYPLSGEQIDEALDAYDIPDLRYDEPDRDPIDMAGLAWAKDDCLYVMKMIEGWTGDNPSGRHPWVLNQHIRLESARRYGCLTEVGYQRGLKTLNERYLALTPVKEHPRRLRDAERMRPYAIDCVARKTDQQVAAELGNHTHHDQIRQDNPQQSDSHREYGYLDWETFWDERPPVAFLIPELIPEGVITSIWSQSGVGKSLLALEWALALVLGRAILGEPVVPRTVLYIDQENPLDAIRDRFEAFGVRRGDELAGLHYSHLGEWPSLDSEEGGKAIRAEVQRIGADLVVIDTTGRVLSGDEKDAITLQGLWQHTLVHLRRQGVSVWLIDHAGKDLDKEQRGSSAKKDLTDLSYRITPGGHSEVTLKRSKNRPGLPGPELIKLLRVGGDGDQPLTHQRVDLDSSEEAAIQKLVDAMDDIGLPDACGRPTAREALKGTGIPYRTDPLAKALIRRKARAQ